MKVIFEIFQNLISEKQKSVILDVMNRDENF